MLGKQSRRYCRASLLLDWIIVWVDCQIVDLADRVEVSLRIVGQFSTLSFGMRILGCPLVVVVVVLVVVAVVVLVLVLVVARATTYSRE